MKASFDVDGLDEVEAALSMLDSVGQTRSLRSALKHAAEPVEDGIRNNIRSLDLVDTGQLMASVKSRTHVNKNGDHNLYDVAIFPGVYKNAAIQLDSGKLLDAPVYGYFLEFGTAPHDLGNGLHPGMSATPFVRPALDANIQQSTHRFKQTLVATITRRLRRKIRR